MHPAEALAVALEACDTWETVECTWTLHLAATLPCLPSRVELGGAASPILGPHRMQNVHHPKCLAPATYEKANRLAPPATCDT